MFQVLFTGEPLSVNNDKSEKKEDYKQEILNLFSKRYPDDLNGTCPIKNTKCYFLMMYFYKGRKKRDIDNILKYTIDSLRKKVYNDDKYIEFCISESISCNNGIESIDMTYMDEDIACQIYDFISDDYDKNHASITYIECGLMNDKFYKLGLEKIWK